jgi:hypothetical protein
MYTDLEGMIVSNFISAGPRWKNGQWCSSPVEYDEYALPEDRITRQFVRGDAAFYELVEDEEEGEYYILD